MSQVDDHLKVLGLNLGASQKDIRAAYRKLAKRCHPDTNASDTASLEFEKVQCAYEALRSHRPRQRARQPSGPSPPSRAKRPLACTSCGRATLSPRYTRTTTVLSFLFASRRISNEAILCHGCARLRVLRANALIGLFGWWSIQGIFLAPLHVRRNVRASEADPDLNLSLLCHNLTAYRIGGDAAAVRELSSRIAAACDVPLKVPLTTIANSAPSGEAAYTGRSGDSWNATPLDVIVNLLLGVSGPGLLLIASLLRF